MKKRIAAVLMIVLALSMLMATVAYAEDGSNGSNPQTTQSTQLSDSGKPDRAAKKAERLKFFEQVRPLIQEIKNNREQIKTLKQEFAALRLQVKERLEALKQNPGSLTQEQLQLLKTLKTQLRDCKDALIGTNINMSQHRLTLRQMRRGRNYEAVLTAYGNIITIQKERMERLSNMKEICQQILAVG